MSERTTLKHVHCSRFDQGEHITITICRTTQLAGVGEKDMGYWEVFLGGKLLVFPTSRYHDWPLYNDFGLHLRW